MFSSIKPPLEFTSIHPLVLRSMGALHSPSWHSSGSSEETEVTMTRGLLAILVAFLFLPSFGFAAEESSWDPHVVVLATLSDYDSACAEAERASHLLGYAIDGFIDPDETRETEGHVISVHQTEQGLYELVGSAGDKSWIEGSLAEARKVFPSAFVRKAPDIKPGTMSYFWRTGVLVAGAYASYHQAVEGAKTLEAASGIPYGTRGLIYDEERGLGWWDDAAEWERGYFYRRYDSWCGKGLKAPCLTVEPSDGYPGFESGSYTIVAGIMGRGEKRDQRLAKLREFVPDAYVKETNLYMGCTR
jgi:hypothetical protein